MASCRNPGRHHLGMPGRLRRNARGFNPHPSNLISKLCACGLRTLRCTTSRRRAVSALAEELRRQFPDSGFVFATERGGPFTADAVNRLIKRIGKRAGFAFPVHATCCATAAAMRWPITATIPARIQDWLGHRSIQHTVRYTELSPTRFKDFWRRPSKRRLNLAGVPTSTRRAATPPLRGRRRHRTFRRPMMPPGTGPGVYPAPQAAQAGRCLLLLRFIRPGVIPTSTPTWTGSWDHKE